MPHRLSLRLAFARAVPRHGRPCRGPRSNETHWTRSTRCRCCFTARPTARGAHSTCCATRMGAWSGRAARAAAGAALIECGNRSLKDEVQTMRGAAAFKTFYQRLQDIQDYHRRFPHTLPMRVRCGSRAAARLPALTAARALQLDPAAEEVPEPMFTGEEGYGKFLDLHELHTEYNNLPDVQRCARARRRWRPRAPREASASSPLPARRPPQRRLRRLPRARGRPVQVPARHADLWPVPGAADQSRRVPCVLCAALSAARGACGPREAARAARS